MRSTAKEFIAMRAVIYACLVIVGVGISDRMFFRGSFFPTADAQQIWQVPQAQQTQLPKRPPYHLN